MAKAVPLLLQSVQGAVYLRRVFTGVCKIVADAAGEFRPPVQDLTAPITGRAQEVGAHATEHRALDMDQPHLVNPAVSQPAQRDAGIGRQDLPLPPEPAQVKAVGCFDQLARSTSLTLARAWDAGMPDLARFLARASIMGALGACRVPGLTQLRSLQMLGRFVRQREGQLILWCGLWADDDVVAQPTCKYLLVLGALATQLLKPVRFHAAGTALYGKAL